MHSPQVWLRFGACVSFSNPHFSYTHIYIYTCILYIGTYIYICISVSRAVRQRYTSRVSFINSVHCVYVYMCVSTDCPSERCDCIGEHGLACVHSEYDMGRTKPLFQREHSPCLSLSLSLSLSLFRIPTPSTTHRGAKAPRLCLCRVTSTHTHAQG